MIENDIIVTIETKSEISLPIWSLGNFLNNTMSNYLKIVTLREICNKFYEGARDDNFYISVNSYDLFPSFKKKFLYDGIENQRHEIENIRNDDLVILTSKEESALEFWHYFRYLRRPIVLFYSDNKYIPLYEIDSSASLKINSLSMHSPVSFSLQGVLGALADIFTGKWFAQRENERNAQAIANVEGIVRTSHLIEDRRTPPGVRHFASDQMETIMNKQAKINRKLGINEFRIKEENIH